MKSDKTVYLKGRIVNKEEDIVQAYQGYMIEKADRIDYKYVVRKVLYDKDDMNSLTLERGDSYIEFVNIIKINSKK